MKMVTNERLDKLANDPMICNITLEVQECLRELIAVRSVERSARSLVDAKVAEKYAPAISNFDVLKKMCADNRRILMSPEILQADQTRLGTRITFGIGDNVVAEIATDKMVGCVLLWDKEQFDEVKEQLENGEPQNQSGRSKAGSSNEATSTS